jgi:CRISPR-associated endonuclease/helicase Cas3
VPNARPLEPAAALYARCVTIKKFTEAEPFLDAARRQLDALGITGTLELPLDEQGRFRRRIITIAGKHVVGFSLAAHNLNDEDSLLLQAAGLGGRRAMGAGHFNRIASNADSRLKNKGNVK